MSSPSSNLRLPRLSNRQYDEVEALAREKHIDLSVCPTCRKPRIEVAPGIWIWDDHSTYRLYDQEHQCHCGMQEELQRHYLLAGIPKDYWTLSEQEFFGDPAALATAQDYLANWVDYKWHGLGVQFYSPTQGTGKTMLATLIAKDLIKRGEHVYFTSFRDAVRLYDMPYEAREAKVNRLRNSTVLVLDEVTKAISDSQHGYYAVELEDLIRFRTSGNGVTIVTTNLTTDELDEKYPRTFSLLASKQKFVSVQGKDVRRNGAVDLLNDEIIRNKEARPIV